MLRLTISASLLLPPPMQYVSFVYPPLSFVVVSEEYSSLALFRVISLYATWSLKSSFTFSENVSIITFLFKHACVLYTQQLALDLESLNILSLFFPFINKIPKNFWVINTLYIQSVIHPNYGFDPTCFHFSALLGMACGPDLCLSILQVLPNISPPLWSPPLSNFRTSKECSLYFFDSFYSL